MYCLLLSFFFFFNDTATTEIYTLSLHDALPISRQVRCGPPGQLPSSETSTPVRSEDHTSELQSPKDLVCRLLLEKKKRNHGRRMHYPIISLVYGHNSHGPHL